MRTKQLGIDLATYKSTARVLESVLAVWPEHERYCQMRFHDNDKHFLARMDVVSDLILKIANNNLEQYCVDYRWMCEEFLQEELHFRRHGRYRLTTFEDAVREVYSRDDYMSRYVRGILISQLLWTPHAKALDYFREHFLTALASGSSYLEIGPGHGLFLYFAANSANVATIEAWDVSASSITETRAALKSLGVERPFAIFEQDILNASSPHGRFDAAVISEVLEHLERPDIALRTLWNNLRPGGQIFINAPLNSPAPDHIYLWRTPEEFRSFVSNLGFEVQSFQLFPVTGATVELALRQDLSISCVVTATRTT